MILVMLGTQNNSFHRLLEEVQNCIDKKIINENVIVQAGSTKFKSKDMEIFDLINNKDMNKYIKEANYIITHGGVGSIITSLKMNKKVIAVPRYKQYGEHINDHQIQIIQTLNENGFIKGICQVSDLEKAIKEIENFVPAKFVSNTEKIINIIENFIERKKILFSAHSLDVGGIEKSLITLLNYLERLNKYDITLALEKKQGIFLNEINPNIKIIEYKPSESKNILKRKILNLYKRIKFILKYKNKFDFSASFATYSLPASFISRTASKNSYLWGHADYLSLFHNNEQEMKKFFEQLKYNEFKKVVFVSQEGKSSFVKIFPEMKEKTLVCNNLIDDEKILKLSNEKIELEKDKNITTFINIGRHEERQKKLSRLIEAASLLKKDNYNFKILFIGDGPETKEYQEQVKKNKLEENIIFLGRKENPYPYFKISDCVILTSDYEGYPVVFLESFILNKPIITTKVSDYDEVKEKYGYITEKDVSDIYEKMKLFINNGFKIKEKFDCKKYNDEIIKKLENMF